jgi:isopentenyl diphosphate isomerase/L-lactate dehydrogenase-like FMN-dependent dehydrogenase
MGIRCFHANANQIANHYERNSDKFYFKPKSNYDLFKLYLGEDAIEAVKHNVDAIIVSNHGGRQLDSVLAPIEALPEVVEAVAGRCDVYVDGGIRTGGDVFKALALGAKCVFVGRPIIYALAHSGEAGVRKAIEILQEEFDLCMALAGK